MSSVTLKFISVSLSVSTSLEPWSKKQKKLKKKYRKPRKQMYSVNIDILCGYNDRLRIMEHIIIPNLGRFICTDKDKNMGTLKLKSINFLNSAASGFEFFTNLEIDVAPLYVCVAESSSTPIIKSSNDPRHP